MRLGLTRRFWTHLHRTGRVSFGEPTLGPLSTGDTLAIDTYGTFGPPLATVLVLHGPTPLGHRDPRVVRICDSLRSVGVRAICPSLPDVARRRVRRGSVRRLEALFEAVGDTGAQPPGVLAFDWTASLALRALGRSELDSGAVLAVGAMAEARKLRGLADPIPTKAAAQLEALSPLSVVGRIRAPVVLVRPASNPTLPASESMALHAARLDAGARSHLAVTNWIDGNTLRLRPQRTLTGSWTAVKALALWFHHLTSEVSDEQKPHAPRPPVLSARASGRTP